MRLLPRTAIPLLALVVAAAAAPSAGAAGWVTGPPLSPPDRQALTPMVGLTPSGDRAVAWEQRKDGADRTEAEGIATRIAPAGGDFGPVQLVGDGNASSPALATGADDTVALAWRDGEKLRIARRAPGQTRFTEVAPFAFPAGTSVSGTPELAVQGGDVFVAVATQASPGNIRTSTIRALRLPAGATVIEALPGTGVGGVLDTASFDSGTQPAHRVAEPTIVVGGGIHVAWEDRADSGRNDTDSITTVRRSTRSVASGPFGAPVTVDTIRVRDSRADVANPTVVTAAGHVELAWIRERRQQVAVQSLVGGGDTVRTVQTAGLPFDLRAGVDRDGAVALAWDETSANDFALAVFGAKLAAGAPLGAEKRLTQPNTDSVLDDLAVGADGSAVIVPNLRVDSSFGSAATNLQAAFAAPGAEFGGLEKVSGSQERVRDGRFDSAAAAVGGDGRSLVAWAADDRSGAANDRLFLSERDATPPSIGGVTVPAGAAPGTPLSFAAEAADALSPVTVSWDFGDGSRARGGLVAHTYGAPGSYTVTVTATDSSGNAASDQRTVAIAPPAANGGAGPDRTAPRITSLKSSRKRFRAGTKSTAVVAAGRKRTPSGTTFSLSIDERAALVVSFKGKVRRKAITVPGVIVRGARGPGTVAIAFSGRLGGARLAPGSYVASVSAIDGAGNRSRPATVRFTVVSR